MKKSKKIVIGNPLLQRIRNNFRLVLVLESNRRLELIADKRLAIEQGSDGKIRDLSAEEKKEVLELCTFSSYLSELLRSSICVCGMCPATDKDMEYNPTLKRWYCLNCFKDLQSTYIREKPLMLLTDDWDESMEHFFSSFF